MKIKRCVIIDNDFAPTLELKAAETVVHVYIRTPHKSINFETPLEKFVPKQKT